MNTELQIFKNEEFGEVRTVEENGQIYFCGSDVAKALGYADSPKAITTHCKEDGWAFHPVIDNLGRTQQAKFINEGNLYRLIVNSKLESAEKFEKWVFDEVLPTIRKTGSYNKPMSMEDIMIYQLEETTASRGYYMRNHSKKYARIYQRCASPLRWRFTRSLRSERLLHFISRVGGVGGEW